ncbi:hypothetical protein [Hyphomicrobium sp. CS1BSMeth3]|uniref:hypothetical protein n=1 Tax=Hyphomicrobium sp. CS1BSMeth3 TaxID=1892844 RepID=UPI0011606D8F|nr:hypothetical protein [Hyphomicrobium sp. CS1BSMeth3]
MKEGSEAPYTPREWLTAFAFVAAAAVVLYVVLWAAELAADHFELTGILRAAFAIATIIALVLMFSRGLWALLTGLGAVAALVATATFIVHFQILPAIGFAVLAMALGAVFAMIVRE